MNPPKPNTKIISLGGNPKKNFDQQQIPNSEPSSPQLVHQSLSNYFNLTPI